MKQVHSAFGKLMSFLMLGLVFLFSVVTAEAQSYPPAWNSASLYAVGDTVQVGGNWYRCIKPTTSALSPLNEPAYWELSVVRSDTTILVGPGQTFTSFTTAWNYALNARVADGAYLHFYISSAKGNFSQAFTAPLLLDHGSGARVAILGDNQANDVLSFPGTNGVIVDTGHSLNTISGITINDTKVGLSEVGIKVGFNASISNVASATVDNFPLSVMTYQGGGISLDSSLTLSNFSGFQYACLATSGGSIVCPRGLTILGSGFEGTSAALGTTYGGVLIAEKSSISNCAIAAEAENLGVIDITGSTVTNSYNGIYATDGGNINAQNCVFEVQQDACDSVFDAYVNLSGSNISGCDKGCMAGERGVIVCDFSTFARNNLDLQAVNGGYIDAYGASYSTSESNFSTDGSFIRSS